MAAASPLINIMKKAATKASRSLLRDFGEVEQLQVSQKGPGDFVSAADRRAEKILHQELENARPGYSFLMEESGRIEGDKNEYCWIIDPLDGTTNFLHGIPHWAISIALSHNDEIIAGVVYDPVKDQMFTAEKGGGAFERRQRLRVSSRRRFIDCVIATGAPLRTIKKTGEQFIAEYQAVQDMGAGLRRFGAAALDLAYVAAGRCDAFWERNLQPWDVAAGTLIVKESGGFIADLDDKRNNPVETGNILAGNSFIFDDLHKALQKINVS